METEPVIGDVRDPYAVPGGWDHAQGDEAHGGGEALLPEIRDKGQVARRDAAAEEEGGRGDRLSLPPPEVIPDRGVWSEPDAAEVIEEPADRRLGQFVSDRQGGKPDPQRLLVPDRVDGEFRRRREVSEERIEVDRHAAQLSGMMQSGRLEVLAKIPRFRR